MQDKFKEWEASGVVVVPVLSQPDDDWTGEQGYVQAAFAKTKGIIKAAQAGAFLCGHKEMAQVCVTHALTLLTFCISSSLLLPLYFFLRLRTVSCEEWIPHQ
jgi:NAD(P)H-flavin reductase